MEESKEFSDYVFFNSLGKGEGRHKRIQAVSPLFIWKREKRDTKRIQAINPCWILLGKERREWKDITHLLFSAEEQGLENRKLRKLFGKGRIRKMRSKGFKISKKLFMKF